MRHGPTRSPNTQDRDRKAGGAIQTRNNKGNTLVLLGTNTGGGGRVLTEDGKGSVTSESPRSRLSNISSSAILIMISRIIKVSTATGC